MQIMQGAPIYLNAFLLHHEGNTGIPSLKRLGKDAHKSKVKFYSMWTVFSEPFGFVPITTLVVISTCCEIRAEMDHTSNPILSKMHGEISVTSTSI